jgi:hypothetical protein
MWRWMLILLPVLLVLGGAREFPFGGRGGGSTTTWEMKGLDTWELKPGGPVASGQGTATAAHMPNPP